MKLKNVISRVDGMKPNAFSNEVKTGWVNELENMVQTEIFLLAPEEMVEYTWEENAESELLIKAPYSKLYWIYLSAMIDFTHGEYDKYSRTMQMFNAWLQEYQIWYARTFRPADGGAVRMGYYLSAYGLAKLHGFEGTEEDWLEALRGEKGDPFTYEDFTPEQLEALRGPQGEMLVSLERTAGDGSPGTVDTYTVTSNTGKTWSLQVRNGPEGPRGYSPTVNATPTSAGVQLTIKNYDEASGMETITYVNVKNGDTGLPGSPGTDGVKGDSCNIQAAETDEGVELTITNTAYTNSGASHNVQKVLVKHGEDGSAGVFIATYGETPFADIRAAYDAGKMCFCKSANGKSVYTLLTISSAAANFAGSYTYGARIVAAREVDGETTWTDTQYKFVREDGDTMTGSLTLFGDPTEDLHAATKRYVDDHAGGTPEIFIANYGETPYADVKAAHDAGKLCFCNYNNTNILSAVVFSGSSWVRFSGAVSQKAIRTVTLKSNDTWETLTATLAEAASALPAVTADDNGKFLRVVNGAWAAAALESAEGGSF